MGDRVQSLRKRGERARIKQAAAVNQAATTRCVIIAPDALALVAAVASIGLGDPLTDQQTLLSPTIVIVLSSRTNHCITTGA